MPNHVIRDRIWESSKLSKCSRDAALAYPWIFLVADAWGRFEYNPRRIWTRVFGSREDVSLDDVSRWLAEYEANGLLFRYHIEGDLGFWMGFYGRANSKRQPSHYPDPEPFMRKARKSGRTLALKRDREKSGRTLAAMDKDRDKELDKEQEVLSFYNGITNRKLSIESHRRTIKPRLDEGVSPTVLKLAIVGVCLKTFHLGHNDRNTEYLDPETIFRPGRFDGHADFARRATYRIAGAEDVWQFWMPQLKLSRQDVMRHFFIARDKLLVEEGREPVGPAGSLGESAAAVEWQLSA